eukprot:TRINITY_DN62991_c0_g1_i1.p1 TRINITY_DN62991_c0_g1~~TRINITY_DN62991_c0_g1_i1.p1  ORF type:complete len:410 (-),score=32.61 TRINITY_DN62991_c0_g1_i1:58-1287(-)
MEGLPENASSLCGSLGIPDAPRASPRFVRVRSASLSKDFSFFEAAEDLAHIPVTVSASSKASKASTSVMFTSQASHGTSIPWSGSANSQSTAHDSKIDPLHGLRLDQVIEEKEAILDDTYEFIRPLGEGSFGFVRLFRDPNAHKDRFAVKTIVGSATGDNMYVLKKELRIASILKHPNIVMLHAVFKEELVYHLVMEYCEGGDLLSYINRRSPHGVLVGITCDNAISALFQMLSGLAYLHHYRMAHRDIKPQNYMLEGKRALASRDEPIKIKLIDFGFARITDSDDGMMTSVVGTWQYAAPEVIAHEPYRKSCDMWSIGCTLFALCAAELPFEASSADELMQQLNSGVSPKWTAKRLVNLDSRLKEVLSGILQVDPLKRPSAANVLAEEYWIYEHHKQSGGKQKCCSLQ